MKRSWYVIKINTSELINWLNRGSHVHHHIHHLIQNIVNAYLHRQCFTDRPIRQRLPAVTPIDFIEGNDKWRLLAPQHIERLDGLLLQPVHEINYQDCNIAE